MITKHRKDHTSLSHKILLVLISSLLFLLILLVVFKLTLDDHKLQNNLIVKYTHSNEGVGEHHKVLTFIMDQNDSLNINRSVISNKEINHLEDVKMLYNRMIILIYILLIIVPLLILFLGNLFDVLKYLIFPSVLALLILFLLILFPQKSFQIFHEIFFIHGNYSFNPSSFLITLYSPYFFYALVLIVFLRTFVLIFPLIIIGLLLSFRLNSFLNR